MGNHEKYSDPTADLAVGRAFLLRPAHYPKHLREVEPNERDL